MVTQIKEWTDQRKEAETTSHQSWARGIPLLLSCVPSAPAIDDARKFIAPGHRDDEKRHQVVKSDRGVLALRWSDVRNKVLLVDILTGKVKAEWSPSGGDKSINVKAA